MNVYRSLGVLAARAPLHRRLPRTGFYQCLHTSSPRTANPLPHQTAPAPPPDAPLPTTSEAEDRVSRKRRQAELLQQSQSLRPDPKRPTSTLQKRFWKDVSVQETPNGYNIFLDKRPVRTATKDILSIPSNKHQLATAIALEWDSLVSAQQALKTHYIPLTSLASRAVDIENADREGKTNTREDIIKMLLRYLSTDTLLCWAPEKNIHEGAIVEQRHSERETLRDRQKRVAEPIISYLAAKVWPGVEINPIMDPDSILPKPQPSETMSTVRNWLSELPAYELAGLERAVLAGKSLLVGARLLVEWSQEFSHLRDDESSQLRFGIKDAAAACTQEVRWQTDMWGEVEDTHDVDEQDLNRQLGSVVVLVNG